MASAEKIRETLAQACQELNPEGQWPVDVLGIATRLGLGLRYEPERRRGNGAAYLEFGERPTIVIIEANGPTGSLGVRDRFSIAHELMHWVVWRRLALLPGSHREYWHHERLCNEFAGRLLVPGSRLESCLAKLRDERHHPLSFPGRVAREANVSWEVAARSISALASEDIAYLRLVKDPEGLAFEVNCSSVTDKSGSFIGKYARVSDQGFMDLVRGLVVDLIHETSVTVKIGGLLLDNASCAISRIVDVRTRRDFVVMQFRQSDERAVILPKAMR